MPRQPISLNHLNLFDHLTAEGYDLELVTDMILVRKLQQADGPTVTSFLAILSFTIAVIGMLWLAIWFFVPAIQFTQFGYYLDYLGVSGIGNFVYDVSFDRYPIVFGVLSLCPIGLSTLSLTRYPVRRVYRLISIVALCLAVVF